MKLAAQIPPCIKDLKLMSRRREDQLSTVAIALGHPLGRSAARISTIVANLMERKDVQLQSGDDASYSARVL